MKYYYLKKDKLIEGKVHIIKQTTEPISNYKGALGGNIIKYVTEDNLNIPNNWGYLKSTEKLYNKDDAPTSYHSYTESGWEIVDTDGYKEHIEDLLKGDRDSNISEDIFYNNKYIQVRNQEDLDNIEDIKDSLSDTETTQWITSDNSLLEVSKADLESILNTYKTRKMDEFSSYAEKRVYLYKTEDIDEITKYFSYLL